MEKNDSENERLLKIVKAVKEDDEKHIKGEKACNEGQRISENNSVFQPKIAVLEHYSFIEEERKAFYDPYRKKSSSSLQKERKVATSGFSNGLYEINDKENFNVGNPRYALMELKTGAKRPCSYYDPIGELCNIPECIQCPNSEYKITFDTGVTLKTKGFDEISDKEIETFVIKMPNLVKDDIYDYLINDENDYGIVRLPDKTIMRYTKKELYKAYGRYPIIHNRKKKYENKERLSISKASEEDMLKLHETIKPIRDEDILFMDYKPLHITKEPREKFMKLPYRFKERLSLKIRMGMFYTDEEWDDYVNKTLSTPLPGEDKKTKESFIKRMKNFLNK